jgi:hypothetical protein
MLFFGWNAHPFGEENFQPLIVPSNYTTKINAAFYGMEYGIQLLTQLSTTPFFFFDILCMGSTKGFKLVG